MGNQVERHHTLIKAFKDYHENNGVLATDTCIELEDCGYAPEIIVEKFAFGESPSIIIRKEEVMT